MFAIHAKTVNNLRTALLPLATICSKADIKCTIERWSIIGVPSAYPFVASLRMMPTFFSLYMCFSDGDGYDEYRTRFNLGLFATNISNLYTDDLSMTIILGQNPKLAPVKFESPQTGYLQYSGLLLSHPLNIDISPIDFGVFVAIRSPDFINLVSGLVALPNELVSVTVTRTEAKFSALTREVIFRTENNDCLIGGVSEGGVFYFMLTFEPTFFFYHMASTSKFVWIMKTVSSRNLLCCCVGLHASYLVCF